MKIDYLYTLAAAAVLADRPTALGQSIIERQSEDLEARWTQLVGNITDQYLQSFNNGSSRSPASSNCTSENLAIRKEYGSLSIAERSSYVDAVKCLQRLPPRTPSSEAAGAKSRFDDFVAVHINQTLAIHYSGVFMAWHRWFTYLYETALRDECGYTAYQPYWDWPKYQDAPQLSPVFYGPYSLGGNGDYVPHNGTVIVPPDGVSGGNVQLPAGVGGGYVTTGPFANMTINLGPVAGTFGTIAGPDGGFGYNPRGLKRDLGPAMNQRYNNYTTVLDLLDKDNITNYRLLSEGIPYTVEIGPHGGGHYIINGDPGGDLFTSPADPAFWVHHGQMDRLWTLWQTRDPATRYTDLDDGPYGHVTWANSPASRLAALDDVIDMGYAGPSTTIREMMSTTDGPLCYFYEAEAGRAQAALADQLVTAGGARLALGRTGLGSSWAAFGWSVWTAFW